MHLEDAFRQSLSGVPSPKQPMNDVFSSGSEPTPTLESAFKSLASGHGNGSTHHHDIRAVADSLSDHSSVLDIGETVEVASIATLSNSIYQGTLPRSASGIPRPSSRSTSNPILSKYLISTESSRKRNVTDTPSHSRQNSLRRNGTISRPRLDSVDSLVKIPGSPRVDSPSFVPRPISTSSTRSSMSRSISLKTNRLPEPVKPDDSKAYVADPKSKLDMAVGRIVNTFRVSIRMTATAG